MTAMSLKLAALGTVIMTGTLLSTQGATAQDVCDNGSAPQGVAVRVTGYAPVSGSDSSGVKIAGIALKLGTGPQPGNEEVVFGARFDRRRHMDEFRVGRLSIPCRIPEKLDGPRPVLDGGTCWAILKYKAGEESCWHLKVVGAPSTPPFSVSIGRNARALHASSGKVGWNVERNLPAADFVQVKIQPLPDATRNEKNKDEDKAALLFETGPEEISAGDVPRTLDCKEILNRIVQRQLTCQPVCMSEAVYRYLAPYLNPSDGERGQTPSTLGVTAAARLAVLKRADPVWNGQCLLPLKSLTFESAK